jgi:hypothetical protein
MNNGRDEAGICHPISGDRALIKEVQCMKRCRQPWNRIKSEINIPLGHNDYSVGYHEATEAIHQQAIRVMQWQEAQMNWDFFWCIWSWRLESENMRALEAENR